jgi:hypothetical protein
MLAVGSKPGGPFTRVGKGTYALAEPANVAGEEARAEKAEPKPRPRGRKKQAPTA